MTDTPHDPDTTPDTTPGGPGDTATKWPWIAGAVVLIAALVVGLLLITSDDDEGSDSAATTDAPATTVTTEVSETTDAPATTQAPETTEAVATTEPTTAPTTEPPSTQAPTTVAPSVPDQASTAIWPWFATDLRYADPVEAAVGFATEYLGFVDPIASEFMAGDNRSGEVEIRTFDAGPATVVFVRQLTADDSWWALGAASENITVDEPAALAEVTSPLTVSGTARAFEGTVDVQLRADGNGEPIFEGFVTGSGGPEPGPYSDTFEFTSPGETGGALVMLSLSPADGSTVEASGAADLLPLIRLGSRPDQRQHLRNGGCAVGLDVDAAERIDTVGRRRVVAHQDRGTGRPLTVRPDELRTALVVGVEQHDDRVRRVGERATIAVQDRACMVAAAPPARSTSPWRDRLPRRRARRTSVDRRPRSTPAAERRPVATSQSAPRSRSTDGRHRCRVPARSGPAG